MVRFEVDLDAMSSNLRQLRALISPSSLCAVVKANGYGHGAVQVAILAASEGASCLAVALVEEGVALREAGIDLPILVLSTPPAAAFETMASFDLVPVVYTSEGVEQAGRHRLPIHLKVDTGMHRVGMPSHHRTGMPRWGTRHDLLALASRCGVEVRGILSHFAESESNAQFTGLQLDRFLDAVGDLDVAPKHIANTAAAIGFAESRLDMSRIGLGIYGIDQVGGGVVCLQPCLRVFAEVEALGRCQGGCVSPDCREGWVARVSIGFIHGFSRRARGTTNLYVEGVALPVIDVGPDWTDIAVGDAPLERGAEVVVVGETGSTRATLEGLARAWQTSPYEVVARFGQRSPREYR